MRAALLTLALTHPSDTEAAAHTKLISGVKGELRVDMGAVEKTKPLIKEMFEQMSNGLDTPEGISLVDASILKDGKPWMEAPQVLDGLLIIGIAAGLIEFVKPRDTWGGPATWPNERIRYVKRAG